MLPCSACFISKIKKVFNTDAVKEERNLVKVSCESISFLNFCFLISSEIQGTNGSKFVDLSVREQKFWPSFLSGCPVSVRPDDPRACLLERIPCLLCHLWVQFPEHGFTDGRSSVCCSWHKIKRKKSKQTNKTQLTQACFQGFFFFFFNFSSVYFKSH